MRIPTRDSTDEEDEEVIIVKEVISCDVSPVAMFFRQPSQSQNRCFKTLPEAQRTQGIAYLT